MYVCVCRAVTEAQVKRAVANGASTRDAVGRQCGAGTDCGGCHDEIDDLLTASHAAPIQSPCKSRVATSGLRLSASHTT